MIIIRHFAMGVLACDNDFPIPEYKIPVETGLIKYLRMWREDPRSTAPSGETVEDEIRSLLNSYMGECLSYAQPRLRDWWCDDVEYLEIVPTEHDCFKLIGVVWIAAVSLAPFEIDVRLRSDDDPCFAKTIFRIGTLDDRGLPKTFDPKRLDVRALIQARPRKYRDWAMAVELSPPERC